jgi:hypothetical protein
MTSRSRSPHRVEAAVAEPAPVGPKDPPPATPAGRLGNAPIFVDRRLKDCRAPRGPPPQHLVAAHLNEQRCIARYASGWTSLVNEVPATPPLDAEPPAAPPAGVPAATPPAGMPAAAADGPLPLLGLLLDGLPRPPALSAPGTGAVERLLGRAPGRRRATVEAAEAAAAEAADAAGIAGASTRGPSSGSSSNTSSLASRRTGDVFISNTFTDHRAEQLHEGLHSTVEAAVDAIGDAVGTTRVLLNSGLTNREMFESMTAVAQNLLANIFCAVAPTAATLRRLRTP